jgi:hypothetical protein
VKAGVLQHPARGHDSLETMTNEDYSKLTPDDWFALRENPMDKHSAWVQDGVVKMANNEDPHYVEVFRTREEVERFIAYLLLKANEAWPN